MSSAIEHQNEPRVVARFVREQQDGDLTYSSQGNDAVRPRLGPAFPRWEKVVFHKDEAIDFVHREFAEGCGLITCVIVNEIVNDDDDYKEPMNRMHAALKRQYASLPGLFELGVKAGEAGEVVAVYLGCSNNARGLARDHAITLKRRLGDAKVEVFYRFVVEERQHEKKDLLLSRYDYMLNGPKNNNAYRLHHFRDVTGVDLTQPYTECTESSWAGYLIAAVGAVACAAYFILVRKK